MMQDAALAVDVLAKSAVLAAACVLLLASLRRSSAAARHVFLLIALAALVTLPALCAVLPKWQVPFLWTQVQQLTQAAEPAAQGAIAATAASSPSLFDWIAANGWLLLWATGFTLLGVRFAASLAVIDRERRLRPPIEPGEFHDRVAALLGKRSVLLLEGATDQPPMTWGWLRPVLLLPISAREWPEERLRSVVLHELAHIERADWLTHTLSKLACCIYWFHPGVWMVSRQMQVESELAADDRVLTLGCAPEEYAEHLVDVARAVRCTRPLQAVAMAHRNPIRDRLHAILAPNRRRAGLNRRSTWLLVSFGAAAAAAVAAAGPRIIVVSPKTPVVPAPGTPPMSSSPWVAISARPLKMPVFSGSDPDGNDQAEGFDISSDTGADSTGRDPATDCKVPGGSQIEAAVAAHESGAQTKSAAVAASIAQASPASNASTATSRNSSDDADSGEFAAEMKQVGKELASSGGEVEKAFKEANKAIVEAMKPLGHGKIGVTVPMFNATVPEINVDTPEINVNGPKGNRVHVPAIHVRVPQMHLKVPPVHVDGPSVDAG